jgi:hypothetical protein
MGGVVGELPTSRKERVADKKAAGNGPEVIVAGAPKGEEGQHRTLSNCLKNWYRADGRSGTTEAFELISLGADNRQ